MLGWNKIDWVFDSVFHAEYVIPEERVFYGWLDVPDEDTLIWTSLPYVPEGEFIDIEKELLSNDETSASEYVIMEWLYHLTHEAEEKQER